METVVRLADATRSARLSVQPSSTSGSAESGHPCPSRPNCIPALESHSRIDRARRHREDLARAADASATAQCHRCPEVGRRGGPSRLARLALPLGPPSQEPLLQGLPDAAERELRADHQRRRPTRICKANCGPHWLARLASSASGLPGMRFSPRPCRVRAVLEVRSLTARARGAAIHRAKPGLWPRGGSSQVQMGAYGLAARRKFAIFLTIGD